MMIGTVPPSALQAAPVTYDARRSEERDHGGDLFRLGEPADGPPCSDLRQHLVTFAALLVGQPALPSHASVAVGPGVTALQRIPSLA